MRIKFPVRMYPHLGKIAGVLLGLLLGLRIFGIVFGFLCGGLTDILLQDIRLRKELSDTGRIDRIREKYPSQLQGVVKITWIILITASIQSGERCTGPDIQYLQEIILKTLSLSAKGKSIVRHVFSVYRKNSPQPPSIEELAALSQPVLSVYEQVAVARLLYEAVSIGSGSAPRTARSSQYVEKLCVLLGIAPHYMHIAAEVVQNQDNTNYELLGVDREAPMKEIKRVYRTLAAQFHPDSLHGLNAAQKEAASEAFVRIRAAYEQISSERGKSEL